jgi:CheY-like chemotaxis protein
VSDSGRRTLLVVEDEPLVRMLTTFVLRESGFDVLEAGNGSEALEVLANEHHVDLVLSDVRMPVMDGMELSSRLRSSHPGLPILFFSGEAGLYGEALGGARCLKKPLTPQELIAAVNEAITANRLCGGRKIEAH